MSRISHLFESTCGRCCNHVPWVSAGVKYRAMFFLVQCSPAFNRPCVNLILKDPGFFDKGRKDLLFHGLILWGVSAG